jgi:hypothetical protein
MQSVFSSYSHRLVNIANTGGNERNHDTRAAATHRTEPALPHEIGLSATSWNIMLFLKARISSLRENGLKGTQTYEAMEADPIRVGLTARGTLHFESVEIGVILGI